MKRKTVSLCMIARNEEASIGQTIKSALAIVDEIIVGDTGSDDNTRLIAEGYGAKVVDVPWEDDFSAARNTVIEAASSDWILVLDADERLQPIRPVEFQKLLADEQVAGYRVAIQEDEGNKRDWPSDQIRLFRNHPYVRYCYPVHDTIEIALENWSTARKLTIQSSRLIIKHELGDVARANARHDRNRRLLRDAWREYPYEPYFAFCLTSESLGVLEDEVLPRAGLKKSCQQLSKAWTIIEGMSTNQVSELTYGPELAGMLSSTLVALGRTQEALDTVWSGIEIFPDSTLLLFKRAVAIIRHLNTGDQIGLSSSNIKSMQKLAEHDLDECLASAPKGQHEDRWRWLWPLRYQAELALLNGDSELSCSIYQKAISLDADYSHAWSGMADCACADDKQRQALGLYLRAVTLDETNVNAWLRGSEILEILGFTDNARSWQRKARELFPESLAFAGDRPWLDDLNTSTLEPSS